MRLIPTPPCSWTANATTRITIIGPVADDPSWQAQAGAGFAKADFVIDWEARTATCPTGKQSLSWLINPYFTKPETAVVRFSRRDCSPLSFPCSMHAASG